MKIRIRKLALPLADYNYPYVGICTGVIRHEGLRRYCPGRHRTMERVHE